MLIGTSENDRQDRRGKIAEHRTPGAIAAGVAFGIAIGLIPKDSMLVPLLLVFIATLPIHQLLACAIAITLTLVSPWTTPVVHPVGENILRLPLVGSFLAKLYSLPLMPWLRLENTLVAGGAAIGAWAWLPSFLATRWVAQKTSAIQLDQEIRQLASSSLRHRRGPSHKSLAKATASPSGSQSISELRSNLPMAESHHGAEMTIISPVGHVSTELHSELGLDDSPSLPEIAEANSPLHAGARFDVGSREESLRNILKHIHRLRESKTDAETETTV